MSVISFSTTEAETGYRLDTIIATRYPYLSRSFASQLIRQAHITVNGATKKAGYLVKFNDMVKAQIPASQSVVGLEPEPIPLSILFEDSDIIVINKPPGLVVHPAAGHKCGTLANALLHHYQDLEGVGDERRPGIVHRLDKDTSGALVVAKNNITYDRLCSQFKKRQIQKNYLALVYGKVKAPTGIMNSPIGRHPVDRKKMSTKTVRGRNAETQWEIKEIFSTTTLLDLSLKTGRTHQIRVHCAGIGHPVVGDGRYGGKKRWKDTPSKELQQVLKSAKRQMLHAWKLGFMHPCTGKVMAFECPLPEDMALMLETLLHNK